MTKRQPQPALLLLPNLVGNHPHHDLFLPASVDRAVKSLDGLIAESASEGRRYLSRFLKNEPVHHIPIALYHKNIPDADIDFLLEPIKNGERWGFVSDAGLPCIADPGAKLVFRARQTGLQVQAFVGPSSIFLALMSSGLTGQRFAFHGYLDKDPPKMRHQLQLHEKRSQEEDATQIFMEAPFRNEQTLNTILEALHPRTLLCIAWDLTLPSQGIMTQTIEAWKKMVPPKLNDRVALFLFLAKRG